MGPLRSSYHAAQAVIRGKLELTEKPSLDPPPGHVPIRVEASRSQSQLEGDAFGVVLPFGSESKQEPDAAIQPPAESLLTAVKRTLEMFAGGHTLLDYITNRYSASHD